MKRFLKRFQALLMIAVVIVAGVSYSPVWSRAASTTNKLPILCYTLHGRTTTYTTESCVVPSGYIDPVDLTKIKKFYPQYESVQVEYPTARGQKTAYAKISEFFQNINFSTAIGKTGKRLTVFRRSTGNETIGVVYADDVCIVTGHANNRTALIYPVGNGSSYKMGWVVGNYSFEKKFPNSKTNVTGSLRQKLINFELSQLGIGDTRGDNNVKYNAWFYSRLYGRPMTVSGSGYPWCQVFQSYSCYLVTGANDVIPFTASCTSAVNTFKERGQFKYSRYYGGSYTPKAGDIVYYTKGLKYSSCHVGLITASPVNGYLQVVEGNVKASNGDYIVKKFSKDADRRVDSSFVLGYAAPEY